MGMFDKDKEIGTVVTNLFALREPFIMWSARIKRDDYPTTYGPAAQTEMEVSRTADPNEKFVVTTLASAIAAKAREAGPDDFPALVCLTKAPGQGGQEALVIQYLRDYSPGSTAPKQGDINPETGEPFPF